MAGSQWKSSEMADMTEKGTGYMDVAPHIALYSFGAGVVILFCVRYTVF